MIKLWEPFENATKDVSAEKYVTISKVLPVIDEIKLGMNEYKSSSAVCCNLKSNLENQMTKRFKSVEHISVIAQATIIDPRFKKISFHDDMAYKNAIQEISDALYVKRLVNSVPFVSQSQKENELTDKPKKRVFWGNYKNKVQQINQQMDPDSYRLNELNNYLSMPAEDFDNCDPLMFWNQYNHKSPLACYAKKLLTVIATSVPCERIFSKAGRILTEDRNRLSPKHFKQYLFLSSIDKDNWEFFSL
ncbi:hypothetical protein TKK_0017071 [Trichogramma kaykai]